MVPPPLQSLIHQRIPGHCLSWDQGTQLRALKAGSLHSITPPESWAWQVVGTVQT